jgi:hypothetical protein
MKPFLGLIKGCLMAVAAVVLVVLLLIGVSYYFLTRPPEIAKEMRDVPVTPEAAESFTAKLEAFDTRLQQLGAGETVTLTLTEAEVTSRISRLIEAAELPEDLPLEVKGGVQINFEDGRVLALARVGVYGLTVKIAVKARVEVSEGRLQVEVEQIDFGRAPLPGATQERIRDFIAARAGEVELSDIPLKLKSVRLEQGKMILTAAR